MQRCQADALADPAAGHAVALTRARRELRLGSALRGATALDGRNVELLAGHPLIWARFICLGSGR